MGEVTIHGTLYTRATAAAFLTSAGYPVALATLSTLASRGGGPVYYKWGRRALYRPADLLAWAAAKLGPAQAATSADMIHGIARAISVLHVTKPVCGAGGQISAPQPFPDG